MKFILNESNARYILMEDDDLDLDFNPSGSSDELDTVEVDTELISDYAAALIKAQKANNKELVENIWNNFYTKFAEKDCKGQVNADDIKNLGQAFRVECVNLGFITSQNPFLKFLADNTPLTKLMNSQTYGALHNSYSVSDGGDGYIGKEDLLKSGKLKGQNIIFAKDLYSKDANEVITYLKLQNDVIKTKKDDDDDKLIALHKEYFFKSGTITAGVAKVDATNGVLNPITEIEQKLAENGIDTKTTKQKVFESDDASITSLINDLVGKIGKDTAALTQIAVFLATAYPDKLKATEAKDVLTTAKIDTTNMNPAEFVENNIKLNSWAKANIIKDNETIKKAISVLGQKINNP